MFIRSVFKSVCAGLFIFCTTSAAYAQTTAFTYQGKLTDSGAAQAVYQMEFRLFGSAGGTDQIGGVVTNANVAVNQGVFSVSLDFGASVFTGADRFLQISVRRNATETYTILSPREKIASSPYSIRTLSAAQADLSLDSNKLGGVLASEYVTNSTVGSSFIKNAATLQTANFNINGNGFVGGNFGVGVTNNPTAKLQVLSSGGIPGIYSESPTSRAVWGKSLTSRGVYGESSTLEGVFGVSSSGAGVSGNSTSGIGVFGQTSAANSIANTGVYGLSTGNGGVGVVGESNLGNAIGVFGVSTSPTGFGMYARNNSGGRAIYAEGNVAQNLNDNGLVKAMIYINADGTLAHCYNAVTNTSTGNCGFNIVALPPATDIEFDIEFGFQVNNRYFLVAPVDVGNTSNLIIGNMRILTATKLRAILKQPGGSTPPIPFQVFVF